ncbi:hypothetical protein RQP46_005493 [Phenoliferia psychrophenolica]
MLAPLLARSVLRTAPKGVRFASGAPGQVKPTQSFMEKAKKNMPVEVYPLIIACVAMPTYMCMNAWWTIERGHAIGDLRLSPTSWEAPKRKEVWED